MSFNNNERVGAFLAAILLLFTAIIISRFYQSHSNNTPVAVITETDDDVYQLGLCDIVQVIDGDSLRLQYKDQTIDLRLDGIDSPELSQAYGSEAKHNLELLIRDQMLKLRTQGKDVHGRLLGELFLADGSSINREMIRSGYAWWFRDFSDDKTLGELEVEARQAKRGLWRDKNPVPPWIYRHQ
ncbi:thermonuclease family protein [Planctomycetota bacterium]